ncbi:MAG: RluA family pseudouridine synthase, partial [Treponema sp.]|nr:RluA family pseudouridine synthase [Treponema sp.]
MISQLVAGADDDGRRLDRILRRALPELPLGRISRMLRRGAVRVDGRRAAGDLRVAKGQVISLPIPAPAKAPVRAAAAPSAAAAAPAVTTAAPAAAAAGKVLDIIWEGAGLLVLNKPPGLAVHGPESLELRVRDYLAGRIPPSLSFRPGPLHRLDQGAGGIVVFGASLEGARLFSSLMRERRLEKSYLALAEGEVAGEAVWEDTLVRDPSRRKSFAVAFSKATVASGKAAVASGKATVAFSKAAAGHIAGKAAPDRAALTRAAITRVFPLASAQGYSLLRLEIETGRSHQIRAQAAFHGHPLAGDRKYGGRPFVPGRS